MSGGSKTFNRTTLTTLSNEYLDYLIFVISANEPITKNTEDLLRFIFNIDLPIIIIINKIDLVKEEDLKTFISKYKETIRGLNLGKFPLMIKDNEDVALFSSNLDEKDILLTFKVSTLTWEGGLNLFKNFLSLLPQVNNRIGNKQKEKDLDLEKMEFERDYMKKSHLNLDLV